jgi:hypothetical protein
MIETALVEMDMDVFAPCSCRVLMVVRAVRAINSAFQVSSVGRDGDQAGGEMWSAVFPCLLCTVCSLVNR